MKKALNSRLLLIVLALLLAFVLVACERPLNEEEEPTTVPESPTVPEETQPESATPVPGTDTSQPTVPEQPAPEGEATVPSGGEQAQPTPEQSAPTVDSGATSPEGGQPAPAATETPVTPPPQATQLPAQPGVERTHVVQAGENLFRIGLAYGCSTLELSTYNGIANPNWIYVGQVIRIPATCGG